MNVAAHKHRPDLHPLERGLVAILGVELVFLPWAFGTMHTWSQFTALSLAAAAFVIALWPRAYTGEFAAAQEFQLVPWPRLLRFPLFWLGGGLLGLLLIQAANPAWTYQTDGRLWWMRRVAHVEWLPSSAEADFDGFNVWRAFLIYGAVWLTLCAAWVGFTRRRSLQMLFSVLLLNAVALAATGFVHRMMGESKVLWLRAFPGMSFSSFIYKNHAGAYLGLVSSIGLALIDRRHGMKTKTASLAESALPSATSFVPLGLNADAPRIRSPRKTAPRSASVAPMPVAAQLPTPPPATADRIEILLVDDAPEKLLALEASLDELDVQIVKACSGREALRLVLQRDFAVILLDVNMPAMDGFETAHLLRQRPANAHTPIIFVTAFSTGETEMFRGYSLGAVDYLFTPVTPDVLRSKVSVFVELAKRNREIARQTEALRRAEEHRLQQQLDQAAARIEWETRRNHFFRLSIELLAITDYHAVFAQTNPTWERTLGYSEAQLKGISLLDLIHPEDRPRMQEALGNITQAESPLYFETRFRAASGEYRWLGWTVAPFAAEGLLYVFARDMTERREREDEIRRLNESLRVTAANLQTMNQELEAFSYSLAHDLRTPLRAITTYSEVLLTDEAQGLQPEALRIVQSVHRNSVRTQQLMDDFLSFFRIARKDPKREFVNVHALAREAITATQPDKAKRSVEFILGDLPPAKGDPAMLLQVLVNLLSNAVKFTAQRAEARIEIGCDTRRTPAAYFVRDNGIGFDMKYASKLFGVFERLHAREAFDGTGIGLATVQKIIQRHGGAVWAEAEVDRGATFFFTLPD